MDKASNLAIDLEKATADLSKINLSFGGPSNYEEAFDKVVRFVGTIRKRDILSDELNVTKSLAGPFTQGGLLIMLLEPLLHHPWPQGVKRVIKDCNTLEALDEGLRIGSNKALSLSGEASLIDLRPFLSKNDYVSEEQLAKLHRLVFSAIEAKQPNVLLCMSKACDIISKSK